MDERFGPRVPGSRSSEGTGGGVRTETVEGLVTNKWDTIKHRSNPRRVNPYLVPTSSFRDDRKTRLSKEQLPRWDT